MCVPMGEGVTRRDETIAVNAHFDQESGRFDVPIQAAVVQRRVAPGIFHVALGAVLQQLDHNLQAEETS